jgi:hypothetical protein
MMNTTTTAFTHTTLTEITAADLQDGDVVTFFPKADAQWFRASQIERGSAWLSLLWAGQAQRCHLPMTLALYRVG